RVTNGTSPYTVTVDASAIGGSSTLPLVSNGANYFTNTFSFAGVNGGNYTLPVSAPDNASQTASGSIPLAVTRTALGWKGDASDRELHLHGRRQPDRDRWFDQARFRHVDPDGKRRQFQRRPFRQQWSPGPGRSRQRHQRRHGRCQRRHRAGRQ